MTKKVSKKEVVTVVDADVQLKAEVSALVSMSAKIRYLNAAGWSNGKISKYLTELEGKLVRYQWVRNVLITPIKKAKA